MIGHVVAEFCSNKRSMHRRRKFGIIIVHLIIII
jgi:hypothetical protein